ncbi:hypothetical protein AgCh_039259 [Apium graveolens]
MKYRLPGIRSHNHNPETSLEQAGKSAQNSGRRPVVFSGEVESGKLVLEVAEFNLEQELKGLVDMFSVQCINNKVEIFLDLSGIDPSKRESVFESLEQADPSTTRLHGGTRLGLCIVRTYWRALNFMLLS